MTPVLSLDWDYWVKDDPANDYGHGENNLFINLVWIERAASALCRGIDLRQTMGIYEKPHPIDLSFLFRQKNLTIQKNRICIGESHASAYREFKSFDDLWIVHIDSHHDCGYGGKAPKTEDDLSCGNWIQLLQAKKKLKKLTIAYPKWRQEQPAYNEITNLQKRKFDRWKKAGTEVEFVYGLENLPSDVVFQQAYICRSGAWAPPWLDKDFQFCVMNLLIAQRHDAYTSTYFVSLDDVIRDFNWDQVKQHAEQLKNYMETLKKSTEENVTV